MQNQKAEKNNAVYGLAITMLVLLCIGTLVCLISFMFGGIAGLPLVFQLAGLITTSIFINKYNKYGYEMEDARSYGIVFIVFGCLSWGYFIFGIVTGIVLLCNLHNPSEY